MVSNGHSIKKKTPNFLLITEVKKKMGGVKYVQYNALKSIILGPQNAVS